MASCLRVMASCLRVMAKAETELCLGYDISVGYYMVSTEHNSSQGFLMYIVTRVGNQVRQLNTCDLVN